MPTECERSVTSSVTTKISSNEIKDNNSAAAKSATNFNEDLHSSSAMMEGGDMSTSQTSTTSNGSSTCNGGGRKTSITSPDPTAYVAKARVTRPTPPPPPYNPMQFVQIKPCNLYQTAQEQLKKAEEVKKIKEIRKEEPEDWQNNLDNWKSSRRKRVEHIIDRVVEVKKLELEEHDRTRRKSKTFSEMIEERGERAGGRGLNKLASLAVYAEDESNDLSDLGIGTSSASGKSSLSEDYDNNSVMSDNAAELDKAITNSTHHKPANTDSTTREYISSPGYETSSSTAPASSPDPCEYTYEGAIQDYKQRVSRAASGLTAVALNKLTHNQTQQNSKESTPERGATSYPPRRGSKIEDRLMGFEVQSPSSEECVEKSKVDVPKIDISKRKEIFEQQQQQLQQQQQALQLNEPKSSNNSVVVPRVTLRDRFKVETHTETSVTEQPKKELKRLSGDITSIKERLQSLEQQKQQQNLVNGGANGAIKATANKLVDIPVPPLKERLSSLQNAVTKEEIRKPPVVLIDARQLEIMKVEEEKAQQSLKETKEKEGKEKEIETEAEVTTLQQLQKKDDKTLTEEATEDIDRDDSGIHTADDVELEEQQQQRLQADQMMKKEQELKLNAAIEALAKEEQQLSEAANAVNQIEAEFEELTLASVASLPPLATAATTNATAASSSSASASATPITNDHMEYSINEALELALAAIDKETITSVTIAQQQQQPPQPPQQLQPQPENLYPITAPSSNTYDSNSSNNSNNINSICNNNNNNKKQNEEQNLLAAKAEDIQLNKTDEEKYEKLNLEIKLDEKSEEEISQEPIYENITTTNNSSTASIKEVDVALMMSTTTTAAAAAYHQHHQQQQQQQQLQIIPSMLKMMNNTDDDVNNTDNHNNNDDDDNKSSSSNNNNNHKHKHNNNNNNNNNIIKTLQIENSNQNLSTTLTTAAATTAISITTTALASKQLENSQINQTNCQINNNNNNNNNNSNSNSNINNNININKVANDNKKFCKENLDDLTNAFANTTITTTLATTTTTNNANTIQHLPTITTTTVNHHNTNSSCSYTTTSSSVAHLKELNFNQQPLMMTTPAVHSDLNKPEQQQQQPQQQHLQQQQRHPIDDNNTLNTLDLNGEPYYQVPKSNEPYYDAPKHLKPIPVYENIEVFFNGSTLSTELNPHLQPPKEKPPPPPADSPPLFDDVDSSSHTDTWSSDNTYETLTRHQNNLHHHHHQHTHHLSPDQPSPPIKRMNSTKRIKKELRHKRSSFLGIEGSSLDDDESYLELTVAPPPDMAQLLQEERRLEKQLYLKAGLCDSSDTGESRDSGVSENHSRQSSEHYTNSSEENEPHDDTTSPLTLQTQTDSQANDMIYQNDGLLAVVPTPLLQTVKGNSAESWTESATVAAAATQSLTEATATANAKMMSIEEKIREQEEVLRVERELLQLEQEELKRQRENLILRENMARRELQHGAKMLMSANRRSLQDLNGLGAMTVVNIQGEGQISANGMEMYHHHQMHQGLQGQPQLAQPQPLQQAKPQQIYANIPNLQQQYYHMETDYRKSMSDINEFSKRMMSQPPAPPSKPMRAMQHSNATGNANGVIHTGEQSEYAARQRHSLNTQNFGGSLVKIAAAAPPPTAAPRTAAHIYSNYHHQSVQNLAPTNTNHQQVLTTTVNQSLYPGNMSRNTLHALSATPKPKYTDGWVQVQQRKSYDSNLANDPAWLSAYQQKRKSMPDAAYHGYNQNNHWLIQEAEQRRLNEQQQQQQQHQRRTVSSNNTPVHQINNNGSSNSIKLTNGSTVLSTATATTNGKPLPDSIIQTLTERVQSKGIGERKRTNIDKSPLHAASTYHHYQQQQQQQQQYNKLNQTQQHTSSSNAAAIHRHNNIMTTPSTALPSTATSSSMATTVINGQSNITTTTQQQQQQQQQDKVLSVSGKKKCSHCGDELGRGAAMIIESLLLFYHINCFKCCVCHVQLGDGLNGTDVRVRNHKLHCQNCYSSDDGIKFSCV